MAVQNRFGRKKKHYKKNLHVLCDECLIARVTRVTITRYTLHSGNTINLCSKCFPDWKDRIQLDKDNTEEAVKDIMKNKKDKKMQRKALAKVGSITDRMKQLKGAEE